MHSTLCTLHPPGTFDESILHPASQGLKIPSGFSPLPLFYPGYPPTTGHLAFMLPGGLHATGADVSCLGGLPVVSSEFWQCHHPVSWDLSLCVWFGAYRNKLKLGRELGAS